MSAGLLRRYMALLSVAAVFAAISGNQVAVAKSGAPPPAKFTPNVKADASLGSQGQGDNEPQVTVDQSGMAYVTWQGGPEPMVS